MKITWLRRITLTDSPWQSVIKDTINFNELFSFAPNYVDSLLPKIKNKFLKLLMRTLFSQVHFSTITKSELGISQYV